jgi:hypothetical protein
MNWGENFWVWMATEAFFAIFVAALLYYFFVYKQRRPNDKK